MRLNVTLEVPLCWKVPNDKDISEMAYIEKLDLLSEIIARTRMFHKVEFQWTSFTSPWLDWKIEHIPYKKSPN